MMPFDGLRVIEVGTGVAVAYCGKLFADFGAEIVKVEPPGGDSAMRTMSPMADIGGGRQDSLYFAWLNTNKLAVTHSAAGLTGLIESADVLLDARPLDEQRDHPALRAANPGLVICALSPFGEYGPYRDYVATEAVCRALAGGVHAIGPVEGPPVIPIEGQSGVIAGLAAFIAAAAGLFEGSGRRFSLSIHEALMHVMEMDFSSALSHGRSRKRPGVNKFGRHYPSSIYRTADGWIGISTVTPAQWRGFCTMTGRMDLGSDPSLASSPGRMEREAELDSIFLPLLQERSSLEWFELGLKHRLALVIVPSMSELLQQTVHRGRGAFVPVEIGNARFEAPILPQRLGEGGPRRGGRAPLPGEHDGRIPARPQRSANAVPKSTELPLAGVRIIDLTMGWAGPLAARLLADLGAEIIKVESCAYPDWWRGADRSAAFFAQRQYETNNNFNMMNRNKRAVTLDLMQPEGVAALKQLVATAHGLIENYSADVMPKLGLSYEILRRARPDLVMVSMAAFGAGNEWSATRAYGGTLEQASGLPSVSGQMGWPPTMSAYAYGDPVGGFNGAAALLAGIVLQKRTGGGRHVNMSQIEGMLPLCAGQIIEQSATGRTGARLGNRHPNHVPHGCFRCIGADEWIVLTARDKTEWRDLCAAIGRSDLGDDIALATVEGRRAREVEIETAITEWAASLSAHAAMQVLQTRRVPAGAALSATELLHDPHLQARGFWQERERPFVGPCTMLSAPFREGREAYPIRSVSPTLGQDNVTVFTGILDWTDAHLQDMTARKIIGTEAQPMPIASKQRSYGRT